MKINPKKAGRKIFPGLGGLTKNYIKKASLLETTLRFLSEKLEKIISSLDYESDEGKLLKSIKEDMIKLSKYKSHKKIDFYFLCQEIVHHQ